MTATDRRELRVRFVLRVDVPKIIAARVEGVLLDTCKRVPGARLSRGEYRSPNEGETVSRLSRRRDITPQP